MAARIAVLTQSEHSSFLATSRVLNYIHTHTHTHKPQVLHAHEHMRTTSQDCRVLQLWKYGRVLLLQVSASQCTLLACCLCTISQSVCFFSMHACICLVPSSSCRVSRLVTKLRGSRSMTRHSTHSTHGCDLLFVHVCVHIRIPHVHIMRYALLSTCLRS